MNFLSLNVQGSRKEGKYTWVKNLCENHQVSFLALQETKMRRLDIQVVKLVWGNFHFDYAYFLLRGLSGRILCVCDKKVFSKTNIFSDDPLVII